MIKANLIIIIVVAALALSVAGFWIVRDIQNTKIAAPVAQDNVEPASPPDQTRSDQGESQGGGGPSACLGKGILKKNAGDYKGAKEAWEHVVKIRPEDHVAYNNLGDLYQHYLKDYPKAEFYLKKTVELKPDYLQGYTNLHDLYRIFYPPDRRAGAEKAAAVLLDGIKNNPQDYYLRIILASYYKDQGDKQSARKYYEEALQLKPPNKAAIEEELAGLHKFRNI